MSDVTRTSLAQTRRRERARTQGLVAALLGLGLLCGCATGPKIQEIYSPIVQRDAITGRPLVCFDAIGHRPGNVPYALGGSCFCTPNATLQAALQAHPRTKHIDVTALAAAYERQNIKTALHHRHCNNQCEWGPHVALGGHCLVSPEPATANYEQVLRSRTAPATVEGE